MTGQTRRSRLVEWADLVGANLPETVYEEIDRDADADTAGIDPEFDGTGLDRDTPGSPDRPN